MAEVKALVDRVLHRGVWLERNGLPEAATGVALDYRRAAHDGEDNGEAGRCLDVPLSQLHEAPNPGRSWLAPEAVKLVCEVL